MRRWCKLDADIDAAVLRVQDQRRALQQDGVAVTAQALRTLSSPKVLAIAFSAAALTIWFKRRNRRR